MTDYLNLLARSHKAMVELYGDDQMSRAEFLCAYIFSITTYDSELDELFAMRAAQVCRAINERTTYEYIGESAENRQWYTLMLNLPFFADRISWGTSIRGAWWDGKFSDGRTQPIEFNSLGLVDAQGEQILGPVKFTLDEWKQFIADVVAYAEGQG